MILGLTINLSAQAIPLKSAVWTVDYVQVKEGHLADLLQFYKLNWQAARKFAKKAKYVSDYKMYILPQHADYQVILMTKYPDEARYEKREANFEKIFTKHLPAPTLVNGKRSRDMSEVIKSEIFYEWQQE